MRCLVRFVVISLCVVLAFGTSLVLASALLLQVPSVRVYVAERSLAWVRERTGYVISIGQLEQLQPWSLRARGVRVKDPDGHELGVVGELDLGIEPWSLLEGGLTFTHASARHVRADIPASLTSPAASPDEAVVTEEAPTSRFALRFEDVHVVDLVAKVAWSSAKYEVHLDTLRGAGRWADVPALMLRELTLRMYDEKRSELLRAHTREGAFRADAGGALKLTGLLAGAPFELRVTMQLHGLLDAKHVEARLSVAPLVLDSLSHELPHVPLAGTLAAWFSLGAERSTFRVSSRDVRLDEEALPDAEVHGEWQDSLIVLRSLSLRGFEQAVQLSGQVDVESLTGDAKLRLNALKPGRVPWLERLGVGSRLAADLHGTQQSVQARLFVQGPDTAFHASVKGTRPTHDSYQLTGDGRGEVLGRSARFRVRSFLEAVSGAYTADLWLASGKERLRAHAEVDRQRRFVATLETQSLDLANLGDLLGVEGLRGHVESFTRLSGTMDSRSSQRFFVERPRVNMKLTAGGVHAADQGPFDVMLNLEGDLQRGGLYADVAVTSPIDEARINASVRAGFPAANWDQLTRVVDRGKYDVVIRSHLPVERIAHLAGPKLSALRGTLDANLEAHGTRDDPHAELELTAKLGLPAESDLPAELLRMKVVATRERADLELLLRDTQGELLSLKGESAWPHGSFAETIARASERSTELPKLTVRAHLAERRLDTMQGPVAYLAGVYDLALPVRAHAVIDLQGEGQHVDGTARVQLLVFGDKLDANCGLGSQSKIELEAALVDRSLKLKVRAHARDGGAVSGEVHGELSGDLEQGLRALEVRASGRDIVLANLPGMCDLRQGKAEFALQGKAFDGKPARAALQFNVDELQGKNHEAVGLKLHSELDAKSLRAQGEVLLAGKHAGAIDALVPLEGTRALPSLSLQTKAHAHVVFRKLPLSPFLAMGEKLGRTGGHASADVRIAGSLAHPRAHGFVELKQASFSIPSLAQPIHGVDARVELQDRHVVLRRLSARDLGGTLEVRGDADVREDLTGRAQVSIRADKFPVRRQGVVVGELTTQAKVDAAIRTAQAEEPEQLALDLRLSVASGRFWLTGERGRVVQELEPNTSVRFIDAPEQPAPGLGEERPAVMLGLVELKSERDIWLMHRDFSVQVGFDIRLTEDDGPKIEGEARLKRGDLMLLGKSFTLQKGAIRFTGNSPPDPELDLRAVYKPPAGEDLIVQVTGHASSPGLTFSGAATDAGSAVMVLSGRTNASAERQAQADAAGFAASVTAGLLSVTARRELGDWVPMLRVETNPTGNPTRAAAGFDASRLIPPFLTGIARGAYVEGIVGSTNPNGTRSRGSSVGLGVRLELSFPRDLVTTLGYGPGPNWSTDIAWAP